ncbi:MAG: DNA-directed RNA polymerase subunit delta [Streptococcaceae bacterium]|nr:DNA-directed RNA polymerase subunit delta [Streptococcaceae bacterium]
MKIKALEGQDIKELSMIEVAHAILEQKEKEMTFAEILNEVQKYLKKTDEEIKTNASRFYTDMNIDGSFIPLGNNVWALRSWYAIDEIDEEVIALDELDDDSDVPSKKRRVINAFGFEDEVDPEDENFGKETEEAIVYDEENPDDEKEEIEAVDVELEEVDLENEALDLEDEDVEDDEEK